MKRTGLMMRNQVKPAVCVIGLGYIGLPTAAVIARSGCQVTGVDVNPQVVEAINSGRVHIEEADLDGLVQAVVGRDALRASLEVLPADVFIVAVPTPFHADGAHTPDISYVLAASERVAPVLKRGDLLILESTVPVGTTFAIRDRLAALRPDLSFPAADGGHADVAIAYCPERVLPGHIVEELVRNDRSIGGVTPRCARKAKTFYELFVRGACVATDARTAEMTKLVENAYRDVNIAFANELSMIADEMDLDVWDVIHLANLHPRVNILQPGPGVGGHCIAVDPWFIVHGAPDRARLIRTAREVNEAKTEHVLRQSLAMIDDQPDVTVACLGLAFKANIDDFRESPALEIATRLGQRLGDRLLIVEPFASELPSDLAATGAALVDLDTAIERSGLVILLVDHDQFRAIPIHELRGAKLYDTRGVWSARR